MKATRSSLPALIAAASLALAGCAPPYIAELDAAAGLTGRMNLVGTLGPVSVSSGSSTSGVRFLPVKPTASTIGAVSIQAGFVVSDFGGQEQLTFVALDSGGNLQSSGFQSFPLSGADPSYPLYEYDVTTSSASQASLIVFKWDPTTAGTSFYQQYVATLPTGPVSTPSYEPSQVLLSSLFTSQTLLGGSIIPAQYPTQDSFMFLGSSGGVYSVCQAQVNGTTSVFTLGVVTAISGGPAFPLPRTLFSYNPTTGASYASYYGSGQWVCVEWVGTGAPTTKTGITHRIDAVLSTGDLLSTEGGTLRLYDPSGTGTQVASFALKGLQFCYEAYVGSTPYVFFSLPMSVRSGDLAFTVYAVPTSALRSF